MAAQGQTQCEFHERYGNQHAWLITEDLYKKEKHDNFTVTFCPLWVFLVTEELQLLMNKPRG